MDFRGAFSLVSTRTPTASGTTYAFVSCVSSSWCASMEVFPPPLLFIFIACLVLHIVHTHVPTDRGHTGRGGLENIPCDACLGCFYRDQGSALPTLVENEVEVLLPFRLSFCSELLETFFRWQSIGVLVIVPKKCYPLLRDARTHRGTRSIWCNLRLLFTRTKLPSPKFAPRIRFVLASPLRIC